MTSGARARLALAFAVAVAAPAARARAQEAGTMAGGAPLTPSPEHPPAGPLPNVHWLTLDTPHFHIHYYVDELAYAQHAAIIAERAFRLNMRYLNWKPS